MFLKTLSAAHRNVPTAFMSLATFMIGYGMLAAIGQLGPIA